jgi:hypothetical protein
LSNFTVFHACATTGGPQKVFEGAPFHSDRNRKQWLTQGYYFWRGKSLAKLWGETSYDNNYAILKAELQLTENELFDLSSNTEHIEYFDKQLSRFMNHMRRVLGQRYNPTVSACLEYIRSKSKVHKEIFPYIAIMAIEEALNSTKHPFVEGRSNVIALNKRVQVCLFEGFEDRIIYGELIYPDAWVA